MIASALALVMWRVDRLIVRDEIREPMARGHLPDIFSDDELLGPSALSEVPGAA